MLKHRIMWIFWPAFMLAGVLEILVFAMVDPHDLHWFGLSLDLPRQAVYTLGFFAFTRVSPASLSDSGHAGASGAMLASHSNTEGCFIEFLRERPLAA